MNLYLVSSYIQQSVEALPLYIFENLDLPLLNLLNQACAWFLKIDPV